MTQTQTPTSSRSFTPGATVTHRIEDDLTQGEVIESDAWFDLIRLPDLARGDQVLVAWETSSDDGAPVALWIPTADLDLI